jgi:hypothetical protein
VTGYKKHPVSGFSFQFKPYLKGDGFLFFLRLPNDWTDGSHHVKLYKFKPIQKTVDKPKW